VKTLEKPKRVNKRAERSWSKNKALAASLAEKENTTPRQKDLDKPERTRSPRAKKANPKPFVPQPPKRWSEKKDD
jgi:hypothetical protein